MRINLSPRTLMPLLLLLALGIQAAAPAAAQPDAITVDADCSLIDAIRAANTDSAVGSCPAGNGADTILLTIDVTLTSAHTTTPEGANGLPLITSDITILGDGFTLARADGANVQNFRLFQVAPDASLRLEDVVLRNGRLVGRSGGRGRNISTPGAEGDDGEMGSVGFVVSGAGGPGGTGGNGRSGGAGGSGGSVAGGAIYSRGALELIDVTLEDNTVQGGNGGVGGNASRGGQGGIGGTPGVPIPLILFAILGPPGPGGRGGIGGTGGTGGSGGAAYGGAIYNDGGEVVIRTSAFAGNQAFGGTAGTGGRGGGGGTGGPGGLGQRGTLGSGGTGGRGGEGGRGGSGGASAGGALYNAGGSVTISNARFVENLANGGRSGQGGTAGVGGDGGIDQGDGAFGGPGGQGGTSADARGGALFSDGGALFVERSTMFDNIVQGGNGGSGNRAGDGGTGGPVYFGVDLDPRVLTQVLILNLGGVTSSGAPGGTGGNGGAGGHAAGGALYATDGSFTLMRSTLSGNTAQAGAIGSGGQGALAGLDSAIIDLLAQDGIIIYDQNGNGAPGVIGEGEGGGLWVHGADEPARVANSTIANNTASVGGGLFGAGGVQIRSSIIAANTAQNLVDVGGVAESLGYNLIGSADDGTLTQEAIRSIFDVDPLLGALSENGGATETLALLVTSPARNRGACTDVVDQRGYYRVDDACDIGAFEFGATLQRPVVLPPPSDGGSGDESIRAGLPQDVYSRIIARDGIFLRSPAEIGNAGVLDLGVIAAVDVFALNGASAAGGRVCFAGTGDVIFLDAQTSPRAARYLAATHQNGFTCATLPGIGTVVLVGG
ncbi:MAG: hypothetical protein IT320_26900 [Anaerolineae bacterium]|nr:hypothetical protein [Anaerolineae bacterium]